MSIWKLGGKYPCSPKIILILMEYINFKPRFYGRSEAALAILVYPLGGLFCPTRPYSTIIESLIMLSMLFPWVRCWWDQGSYCEGWVLLCLLGTLWLGGTFLHGWGASNIKPWKSSIVHTTYVSDGTCFTH